MQRKKRSAIQVYEKQTRVDVRIQPTQTCQKRAPQHKITGPVSSHMSIAYETSGNEGVFLRIGKMKKTVLVKRT